MSTQALKTGALLLSLASAGVTAFFLWGTWTVFESSRRLAAEAKAPVPERRPAAVAPMLALDEIYVNIGKAGERNHSLVVSLDLELFDDAAREAVDRFRPAVRHIVLETAMEQTFKELGTMAGKLYFKETVVGRINTLLNRAAVRDAHFASFYLQ